MPRRWEPAVPPTAVPASGGTPRTEWAAGLAGRTGRTWIRDELAAAGRADQRLLAIGDGAYAGKAPWQGRPDRVDLLARCAKHRARCALPAPPTPGPKGRKRKRIDGDQAPDPADWVSERTGWSHAAVMGRGRTMPLTFRVAGP